MYYQWLFFFAVIGGVCKKNNWLLISERGAGIGYKGEKRGGIKFLRLMVNFNCIVKTKESGMFIFVWM